MAIDKIKLRHLAKDKDERSFQEGDMLDALNVGVLPEGETSGDVIKNSKSTVSGTALTTTDQIPTEESRVVGSVSDPARGFVYFFVWSTTAANHAIYQYDSKTDKYRIVLKNSLLAFSKFGFVKADVVNGEFQRDETTQTIVYFTDGENPPRKINIDRALSAATNILAYTSEQLLEFLSVIKTPLLSEPKVLLTTDTSIKQNNLYGSMFQFATQLVFKDGETSALSPYSSIVYPSYMSVQGIELANVDQDDIRKENVAEINTRWVNTYLFNRDQKNDVDKLRILGKVSNTGAFFIVDEFDPNIDKTVTNIGDPTADDLTLYDSYSGVYKFYNNGLYVYEEPAVTEKLYDDVPQTAVGQAVVGNRLMYSNPKSGYPNTNTKADLSVVYAADALPTMGESDQVSYTATAPADTGVYRYSYTGTTVPDGRVFIKTTGLPTTVIAGTRVDFKMKYRPQDFKQWGYWDSNDEYLFQVQIRDADTGILTSYYAGKADNSVGADYDGALNMYFGTLEAEINYQTLAVSFVLEEDLTKTETEARLKTEIENSVLSYNQHSGSQTWDLRSSESGSVDYKLITENLDFNITFDVASVSTGDGTPNVTGQTWLKLTPKPSGWFIPETVLSNDATTGFGAALQTVSSGVYTRSGDSFFRLVQNTNITEGLNGTFKEAQDYFINAAASPPISGGAIPVSYVGMLTYLDHAQRTFKSGCTHDFGVVYFDKHGRPGRVNEIGSVYVAPIGNADRNNKEGPCSIGIDFTTQPPSWAESYHIVYADMGSWEKFESYTIGGAHLADNEDDKNLYLSLKTLSQYQTLKGALKSYSYTPGDQLRVLSYFNNSTDIDLTYADVASEYLFDVTGVHTFVAADNPIDAGGHGTGHDGLFISVKGAGTLANFSEDWMRAGGNTEGGSFFQRECLVEILTPRKTISEKVYYEIGERKRVLGARDLTVSTNEKHNDSATLMLNEGSIYWKPTACFVANIDTSLPSSDWDYMVSDDWHFSTRNIESMDASDFVASRSWSKGRAHVKYDKAATVNYFNRIVYSEESGDDIGGIKYSSFNPGALSYKNLNKAYGKVNWIGSNGEKLHVLQENKLSAIGVKRNIVEYSDGAANQTISGDVLGNVSYASGDYGCGSDQSAVLLQDGTLYFVDRSRQKVLKLTQDQLTPISDIDMSSYFESEFDGLAAADGDGGRIISGFDPQERMYYVTLEPKLIGEGGAAYAGSTVGYSPDKSNGKWISRYSFLPSNYANIDNIFLSGKYYASGNLLNNHSDTATRNTFYGTRYDSEVEVISKMYPSEVKVFNALSYEGGSNDWTVSTSEITTNLGQTSASPVVFEEREGAFYKEMPRDGSTNSTSHYLYLGKVVEIDVGNVTMDSRLDRIPIPASTGSQTFAYGDSYNSTNTIFNGFSGSVIQTTASNLTASADGEPLYLVLDKIDNGDPLRGHWAKIKLTSIVTSPSELYCINTHVSGSNLHHLKGSE